MKVIGVMTKNFSFFYELVQLMRERREAFVALDFDDDVPDNVGVIITSREERPNVRFRRIVAADQPSVALDMARSHLKGKESFQTLVAGVDPGTRRGRQGPRRRKRRFPGTGRRRDRPVPPVLPPRSAGCPSGARGPDQP
jgi:hypothetical protein